MKKTALLLVMLIALSACGGGGGSSDKNLFSSWTVPTTGAVHDWSSFDFGSNIITFYTATTPCTCTATFEGNQAEGLLTVSYCFPDYWIYHCGDNEGTFLYSKSSEELAICDNTGCVLLY